MKKLLAGVLIYALTVSQVFGQAALLPNAKQTFLGTTGAPLAGGSVTFYVPGSTNRKTTWQDSAQTSNNTNPVVLDAAGRAVIFGQGVYRQVVKDANGNTIWDAPTTAYGSSQPSGATGTDTAPVGSIIQWSSFTLPTNWQWANGQALSRTDFPDLLSAITISGTAISCTSGSATIGGWADTSQIRIGAPIEGSCIPTGTVVSSISNSSTITISNNATATSTVTATIFPWGNGDGVLTFNVPDLRGRVPAGSDTMQATAASRLTLSAPITTVSGNSTASVAIGSGVTAGMTVVSANVPAGTTVASVPPVVVTGLTTASTSTSATVASATGLIPGMVLTGHPAIPAGTTIASISGTTVTLSAAATTFTAFLSTTASSTTATVNDPTGIAAGMTVTGTGITGGTTVSAISGHTITLSAAAGNNIEVTATFGGTSASTSTTFTAGSNVPVVLSAGATASASGTAATFQAFSGANASGASGGASSHVLTPQEAAILSYTTNIIDPGHYHYVDVATANGNTVTNIAAANPGTLGTLTTRGDHTGISAATTTTAGGQPHSVLQPTLTIGYIIKAKANSTGAGGVVSWGGLFGDIATDATLQAYVSGGVNFAGIANAANQTFLANISGGVAQPTPTTWSAWMDAVCGNTQGNIVFRSASSWSCLAPGANGFVLSTTGAASNPVWVSAPTVTPQSANTVYAGPASGSASNPSFRALVAADLPGTFSGFANPSASIGLTVKNGTAATAMRSDAAPALDQSIAPTWTGQHTFSLVPILPSQTGHFVWMAPTAGGAPAFRALVGSDLPNPSASSLGGVQSFASVSHQFLSQISTTGVVSAAQPACADISNAGTVCTANTGTSGAAVGLLNGNNTYSGNNTFSGTDNFSGTFQIGGNAMTFPGAAATLTQTIASGATAMGTGAIASGACAAAVTATATGTATTDVILASFNGDPTAITGYIPSTNGMLSIIPYPTANTANFKVCNNTNSSITPGAATINWRVVR